ncbi:MAG: tyrosine-type recombinase/integrase [Oscillospiraceae bacterium]|jgi:site-specific recombinase XerD|nr:tyrosine-type recombinase/integrase [Oscillospiraceae bacterium]
MYDRSEAPACVREFLDYTATIKGRSENTVVSYFHDLKYFLRFLKIKHGLTPKSPFEDIGVGDFPDGIIKNVELVDILEFLHFLSSERRNSPKARARRAVALRQFFKYLTNNKQWFEVSPAQNLEMPGVKPPLPKHLTLEQATELLSVCGDGGGWMGARDYCIMTFFLNCGMRLNELVGLDLHDYKKEREPSAEERTDYIKVLGKGSKERIIYLNPACIGAYEAYLTERQKLCVENERVRFEKAMFLSGRFKRISARRVEQIITEKLRLCGLDGLGFSVHKLRHTAATLMYKNGVDVRVLKDVLGHENLGTTQIYTHVVNEQMKRAINNNPLAEVKIKKEDE